MDERRETRHALSSRGRPISSWSVLVSATNTKSVGIQRAWRELLEESDDPFALYQSPEWFDRMRQFKGDTNSSNALVFRRDAHRGVVAVVPLFVACERCRFPLVLGRSYSTRPIEMIKLNSGRLLMRPGGEWFNGLFGAIHKRYAGRPIKIENVPVHSPLYDYLHAPKKIDEQYYLCRIHGFERVHVIPLAATNAQFLERYRSKKRYNLRRQFRLLSERIGGNLKWRDYRVRDDVPELHRNLVELLRVRNELPRKNNVAELREFDSQYRSLAERGLLRSFVLKDGDRPVSCIMGYQFGKTFVLGATIHDPEYAAFSPGVALLHLVIERLINEKEVAAINLAYGNPESEYRSTNVVLEYASYWLFPKTFRNRSIRACYCAFRRAVAALKGLTLLERREDRYVRAARHRSGPRGRPPQWI
jgi:CelD/BcsL family acetyltransferase involved in cellulose biosynthesis